MLKQNGKFESVPSCCIPLETLENAEILTAKVFAENKSGEELIDAFSKNFASQCGFCTSGFAISLSKKTEKSGSKIQNAQVVQFENSTVPSADRFALSQPQTDIPCEPAAASRRRGIGEDTVATDQQPAFEITGRDASAVSAVRLILPSLPRALCILLPEWRHVLPMLPLVQN